MCFFLLENPTGLSKVPSRVQEQYTSERLEVIQLFLEAFGHGIFNFRTFVRAGNPGIVKEGFHPKGKKLFNSWPAHCPHWTQRKVTQLKHCVNCHP